MSRVAALVELMRPRQWPKNGFVLAGLVFGHGWEEPAHVAAAIAATAAFCLGSGAVYAFNDCRDLARDRRHPRKRARPLARGAVSVRAAYALAAAAAAAGLALAAWAGPAAAACLAAYLALNVAYTLRLKTVPVLDVFAIAAGFMLRLLAGTAGIGIEPSKWLLACGFLLTLFLAFAKRRAELAQLGAEAGAHRAVLAAYSTVFLDRATFACAMATAAAYLLYALDAETAARHGTDDLVLTLPWVLLGLFRYLYRLHFRGAGGDPAEELVTDPVLALAVAGWFGTVLWLIG
ncbi:MAG: decaprenyl-phosphate phosphoribosyltransferase [Burkholderiales bacterium]|nr:decaprenyl-phosphate phosphoribosyltransferase [Burkholderiales bacterium]